VGISGLVVDLAGAEAGHGHAEVLPGLVVVAELVHLAEQGQYARQLEVVRRQADIPDRQGTPEVLLAERGLLP
jgi:hypothetical protein